MRRKGVRPILLIGTKNSDKLREIKKLLKKTPIKFSSLKDFPNAPDVVEDGKTFEANARKKARIYSRLTGQLTLADDSGLAVRSLNGRPGVYSARFAGPRCAYQDNNQKLLRLLANKQGKKRQAKFVCVMSLYARGKFVAVVKGECSGQIALSEKGRNGFGYDPVFIPKGFSKTFAELSPAVKNKISHRAKALHAAKGAVLAFLKTRGF